MTLRKHLALALLFPLFQTALYGAKLTPADTAVVVIDVQEDFTEDNDFKKEHRKGRLAVPNSGTKYVKAVIDATQKLSNLGFRIFATQDWHPKNHISFASNHPGKKPFEQIPLKTAQGGMQTLWPDHCVQFTDGANILLPNKLFSTGAIIKKGANPKYDSYSGFADDSGIETSLNKMLKRKKIKNIIIYGIATDYCVQATALHGLARGYGVYLITDLCRGVADETSQAALKKMEDQGVVVVDSLSDFLEEYVK